MSDLFPIFRPSGRPRTIHLDTGRTIYNVPANRDMDLVRAQGILLRRDARRFMAPNAFGWIPRRGTLAALAAAEDFIERHGIKIISFDIRQCFTSTDQAVAANAIRRTVGDRWWQRIIPWLPPHGLPEGCPLTPPTMDLILSAIDHRFVGTMIRYCDDYLAATKATPVIIKQLGDIGFEVHKERPGLDARFVGSTLAALAAP